jgi:hypothetical protein
MEVLAHGSAHARPSARLPIDTSENFPAPCLQSILNHLPQPLRSHIRSFGTLGKLLKLPSLTPQIFNSAGGRGDPRIFFWVGILFCFLIEILILLLLRSPC